MALKSINCNVFQLTTVNKEGEAFDFAEVLLDKLENYNDVLQSGSPISIIEIKQEKKYIFGTLTHTQMNDLSPIVDSLTKSVVGEIEMSATQGLGHFTSFLFDKELQMLVFESKQHGVSLGSFCHFFERNYSMPPIETNFVLNPAELIKLNKMVIIKSFSVKIAKVVNGAIFNNEKASYGQIIKSADDTNTDTLEYTIKAGNSDTLSLTKIKQMARDLFKFRESDEVEKLVISGKESDEKAQETINFVTNRVKITIKVERKRFSSSFALKEKYYLMEEEFNKVRPSLLKAYKLKK
jgi:hypothetical protein